MSKWWRAARSTRTSSEFPNPAEDECDAETYSKDSWDLPCQDRLKGLPPLTIKDVKVITTNGGRNYRWVLLE